MKVAGGVASLLVAVGLYTRWGIDGTLSRDESIYAYGAQQMAHGVPPYVSTFDPKGPLATIVGGAGAGIARLVGDNDIYAIRVAFFVCSCLTVLAMYLLAARLFHSVLAGLVGAVVFASFTGFAEDALSGPDAKTPGILAAVVAMWLLARRQWFWAGVAASLAVLTWQPLVIYPVMAIVVAGVNSPARERMRGLALAVAGVATPLVAVTVYFALSGAVGAAYEAAFAFPATGVKRPAETVVHRLHRIVMVVRDYYHFSGYLFWVGSVALLVLVAVHLIRQRGDLRHAVRDPLVIVVFVTGLAEAAYATYDFQGYPDVLPLLPYPALGLAGVAAAVVTLLRTSPRQRVATAGAVAALAVLTAFSWVWFTNDPKNDNGLRAEGADACAVERMLGPQGTLYALGDPTPLVMTHRRNPDKYIYLNSGVDRWKVAHTKGGYGAWLAQITAADPAVVVIGGGWDTPYRMHIEAWLKSTGYQPHFVGPWRVLITPAALSRAHAHRVMLTRDATPYATGTAGRELPASGCV